MRQETLQSHSNAFRYHNLILQCYLWLKWSIYQNQSLVKVSSLQCALGNKLQPIPFRQENLLLDGLYLVSNFFPEKTEIKRDQKVSEILKF